MLPLPAERDGSRIVLSGDSGTGAQNTFVVDPDSGFLMTTRALDREEKAEYQLQVTLESEDGRVLWGPQLVTVNVKDENDQIPQFSQAIYRAQLSQGTRPGVPFLLLEASDGDAPGTANSDLRFHILSQSPAQPLPDMFQLDPQLGALTLSPRGSTSLDQALEETYQLLVQVKDMGDQPSGHQAIATVEISVAENSWGALEPVHLAENLRVAYPHRIAQVHWSGGDAHYQLESQPPGPFDVDTEGRIHVTMELDREAQAEYQLQVRAQNSRGEDYAEPLELQVVVMDENDNAPVCSPHDPTVSIPELSPPGTEVARLSAEDLDAPGSPNSHIVYQLLSPEPEEGAENKAFELDSTSGAVTLGTAPLHAGQNILLRVLAVDLAGSEGGLSSTCEVAVLVTDINNHAPEFISSHIGPVRLPEDTKPGALVATLTATDADLEPAFRLMDFAIEEGDPEGIFDLSWEPDSDHVQLRLRKSLSYEAAPDHKVVVVVRNVEELVGPGPGPAATATVTILVERVIPPLTLDRESYETSIPVSTPAGSLLLTIQPSDTMSRTLRTSWQDALELVKLVQMLSHPTPPPPTGSDHPSPTYSSNSLSPTNSKTGRLGSPALVLSLNHRNNTGLEYPAAPSWEFLGSTLYNASPDTPSSLGLRFSLVNDSEGWLCIKEVSGEVHTAQSLQGAQPGDTYTVLVKAQDTDEPGLNTSATIVVHFLKASPIPALTLASGPSRHLCTPRQDYGVVVSGVSEDPDLANRNGPYSFALGPNPTVQRDWRLQPLNDSHAYLTLALHWVEPGEYLVPVVVHHDTHTWQLQVEVIVCRCNVEGQCMRKVGRMEGMPTKLSAVGVLLGTLAAIGFILILVFTHLALARKDLDQPADSVPLKAAV
ncbi:Cadherin-16 [Apodemus speciosus]|uniref:Cadherin-16 n=1 Tax=Apodemus speciosus TaxID=105296 RepID=A0ABQ0F380_APOSI